MKTIYEFQGFAIQIQRSLMWRLIPMSNVFIDTRFDFGSPKKYYETINGWSL